MNRELEHLKKMRELLANGWTQGAWARNGNGVKQSPLAPFCASFSITGAALRAWDDIAHIFDFNPGPFERSRGYKLLMQVFYDNWGWRWKRLPEWNDMRGRTQSEVLALIDRAIEIAEAEPSKSRRPRNEH